MHQEEVCGQKYMAQDNDNIKPEVLYKLHCDDRFKSLSEEEIYGYIVNFDIKNATDEDIRNFMAWLQLELRENK